MDAINGDGSELWQYFNIFFIYLTATTAQTTKQNFITLMLLIAFTIFKKAQINEVIKIKNFPNIRLKIQAEDGCLSIYCLIRQTVNGWVENYLKLPKVLWWFLRFISFYFLEIPKNYFDEIKISKISFIFFYLSGQKKLFKRWNSLIGNCFGLQPLFCRILKWNIFSTYFVWIQSCGLIEVIIPSILITSYYFILHQHKYTHNTSYFLCQTNSTV